MAAYDASAFQPPAPVALVTCRSPITQRVVAEVPMLIDSGADVSLLPRALVTPLIPNVEELPHYEIAGFDGTTTSASAVQLELEFLRRRFHGQFLLIDSTNGIIGRNVLNAVALILDGPTLSWREWQAPNTPA